MSLYQRLRDDLGLYLKQGDKTRVAELRLALSNIANAEKAKGAPLEESDIFGVLSKQAKQHKESIEAFRAGGRDDLVAKEEQELSVLLTYLPQPLSREEIVRIVDEAVQEVGAKGPGDKGKVMSKVMPQVKGKADGTEVNEVVTETLNRL